MRDREAGQAGLGLAAAAGRAFIADFAARTGGRTRERGDRGRVVVRFHLDAERRIDHGLAAVLAAGRVRAIARGRETGDHRGVVAVGAQRVLRGLLVGVLDHPEQRVRLLGTVDGPAGIEDLVAAVLGVGLREHHQFHVRRLAAQFAEALAQVVDLVLGHGQAEAGVGRFQVIQRDPFQLTAGRGAEQRLRLRGLGQHGLGHRVVQRADHRFLRGRVGRPSGQIDTQATFDPADRLPGTADQLGGLARPRRQRAQPRHHEARYRPVLTPGQRGLGFQDPAQDRRVRGRIALGLDEVDMPGTGDAQIGGQGLQAGFKTFAAERRKGGCALEDHHVRGTVVGNGAHYCTQLGRRGPAPGIGRPRRCPAQFTPEPCTGSRIGRRLHDNVITTWPTARCRPSPMSLPASLTGVRNCCTHAAIPAACAHHLIGDRPCQTRLRAVQ